MRGTYVAGSDTVAVCVGETGLYFATANPAFLPRTPLLPTGPETFTGLHPDRPVTLSAEFGPGGTMTFADGEARTVRLVEVPSRSDACRGSRSG